MTEKDFYKRLCLFIVYAWHLEHEYPPSQGRGPDEFKYTPRFRQDFAVDEEHPWPRSSLEDWVARAARALRKVPQGDLQTFEGLIYKVINESEETIQKSRNLEIQKYAGHTSVRPTAKLHSIYGNRGETK